MMTITPLLKTHRYCGIIMSPNFPQLIKTSDLTSEEMPHIVKTITGKLKVFYYSLNYDHHLRDPYLMNLMIQVTNPILLRRWRFRVVLKVIMVKSNGNGWMYGGRIAILTISMRKEKRKFSHLSFRNNWRFTICCLHWVWAFGRGGAPVQLWYTKNCETSWGNSIKSRRLKLKV